jgi:hypothetical protein
MLNLGRIPAASPSVEEFLPFPLHMKFGRQNSQYRSDGEKRFFHAYCKNPTPVIQFIAD